MYSAVCDGEGGGGGYYTKTDCLSLCTDVDLHKRRPTLGGVGTETVTQMPHNQYTGNFKTKIFFDSHSFFRLCLTQV